MHPHYVMRDCAHRLKRDLLAGRRCFAPADEFVVVDSNHVLIAFAVGVLLGYLLFH